MGKSNISYLDHVWSPITGCSGKGCQAQCYAREMVKRFPAIHGWHSEYERGHYKDTPAPFSEVRFHPDRLSEPLRRKRPTVYGVVFFGDMFDEQVGLLWQHQVYDVIRKCPQHTFVILTKQAANMRDRLEGGEPLPNVWHGVTVCTQAEADDRIPELLKVPGKHWISIEPMLGPIKLNKCWICKGPDIEGCLCEQDIWSGIDLVILGCESGPKRRHMLTEWAINIVDQCKAVEVPVYVKQVVNGYGKVSTNPAEWPLELRVRELPWRKA